MEIDSYPSTSVSSLLLEEAFLWELESRLMLVYLGRPHSSSEVHQEVIEHLETSPEFRKHLEPLRRCALEGKEALLSGDLDRFGRVMMDNTEAQRSLHPKLIGTRAQEVIDSASKAGAVGWKVNGAGGEGGSITLLLPSDISNQRNFSKSIAKQFSSEAVTTLPIRLAPHGLRRWISTP